MRHHADPGQHVHHGHQSGPSLNRIALTATLHCLTGCAIGEGRGGLASSGHSVQGLTAGLLATAAGFGAYAAMLMRGGVALAFRAA